MANTNGAFNPAQYGATEDQSPKRSPQTPSFNPAALGATPDDSNALPPMEQPQETISACTPSLWERTKETFTSGAPLGSVARNFSSAVYQPSASTTPQLIKPEAALTPAEQSAHPY